MNFDHDLVDENGKTVIEIDEAALNVKNFLSDIKTFMADKYSANQMPSAPPPGTFDVFE